MAKWPWIERTFSFDYPVAKFPDILERLRGTPARLEERVARVDRAVLTRHDGQGWSIQENIGHLIDVESVWFRRLEQLLAGEPELCPADMSGRTTDEANHNAAQSGELLAAFRTARGRLVARLDELDDDAWGKTALHPRLQQPMRLVDLAFFASEHDDYHLARINRLMR